MANPKQAAAPGWLKGSLWAVGGLVVVAVIAMAFEHNVFQHLGMHMGSGG